MRAVSLQPKKGLRLTESGKGGPLITPVLVHLLDEHGNSILGIPKEELDATTKQAAIATPGAVAEIYQFWRVEGDSGTSIGRFVSS